MRDRHEHLYSPGTLLRTRFPDGCHLWSLDYRTRIGRFNPRDVAIVLGPGNSGSAYLEIITCRGMIGCVLDSTVCSVIGMSLESL